MNTILFLVLRRMRTPLLALSTVYMIAVLVMVMIPGVDDQGNPWRMDFFHAFYFVSFMGTTIGFGEIPYAFTDAQRMWALICIYMTVVAWIYAIGTVLALIQDENLRRAFVKRRFAISVRNTREHFYLICGYGDTGSALVETLERRAIPSVVVEIRQERINLLTLQNYPLYVPGLCADASHPDNLLLAGVRHPKCAGVVALTDRNNVNLHIAITTKVLNHSIQVLCRADTHDVEANMASFGTEHIVDPFDTFADHLAVALYSPCQYLLLNWLSGQSEEPLEEPIYPPYGLWILCGYGRFGKAVCTRLENHGVPVCVVEANPIRTDPPDGSVIGIGTEASTLREAGIERAVGIVAGTNDDSNNLSIIMTALEMNPKLFVVVRQNQHFNKALFESADAHVVMEVSRVVANTIRGLLTIPLLEDFRLLALKQDDRWACVLISRLAGLCEEWTPNVWQIRVGLEQAFAVQRTLARSDTVYLGHLQCDTRDRNKELACIPLLLVRAKGKQLLLPQADVIIEAGDRILFAGTAASQSRMQWVLQNQTALSYAVDGETFPQTYVWRWISAMLKRRKPTRSRKRTRRA